MVGRWVGDERGWMGRVTVDGPFDGVNVAARLESQAPLGGVLLADAVHAQVGGAVEQGARVFDHPQCLHRPEVYTGIGEEEAAELLRAFFRERR